MRNVSCNTLGAHGCDPAFIKITKWSDTCLHKAQTNSLYKKS